MSQAQTMEKLSHMRLYGFVHALDDQRESTSYNDLSFDERLAFLVDREYLRRENNRLTRRISLAKLKQKGTLEDIDFSPKRNLDKSQFMELAQCSWITSRHNLIITGPTGVGKTFVACALADKACKAGFNALYIKTSELVSQLVLAYAEGTFSSLLTKLTKTHLLVLDEWLRDPLQHQIARHILDVIDERYQYASTVFISQVPVSDWHQQIQELTIADALLDRVIHDSYRIELQGESQRKLRASSKTVSPHSTQSSKITTEKFNTKNS